MGSNIYEQSEGGYLVVRSVLTRGPLHPDGPRTALVVRTGAIGAELDEERARELRDALTEWLGDADATSLDKDEVSIAAKWAGLALTTYSSLDDMPPDERALMNRLLESE